MNTDQRWAGNVETAGLIARRAFTINAPLSPDQLARPQAGKTDRVAPLSIHQQLKPLPVPESSTD